MKNISMIYICKLFKYQYKLTVSLNLTNKNDVVHLYIDCA